MKRGEVWTVSGGKDYAAKPRPVVIVQDDSFSATDSITVCGFTSDPTEAPLFRVLIEPSDLNGLKLSSRLMIDKLTTVHKTKLGKRIGHLESGDLSRMNQSIIVFLGLANSTRVPGDEDD